VRGNKGNSAMVTIRDVAKESGFSRPQFDCAERSTGGYIPRSPRSVSERAAAKNLDSAQPVAARCAPRPPLAQV